MATDRERAKRILEELRSRPGLYLELLHQMTDAGEVLTPWEPVVDGTSWVRRGLREVSKVLFGEKEREVIALVKGSREHYFAEVLEEGDRGERWMRPVESGVSRYGSAEHCFGSLAEAFAAADAVATQRGYLLPPSREDGCVGPWERPERHPWSSLTALRVGEGCPGVGMVFLGRPAPGEPPYEVRVDGEPLAEQFHSERKAMEAADGELRRLGYVVP